MNSVLKKVRIVSMLVTLGLVAALIIFLCLLVRDVKEQKAAKEEYEELAGLISIDEIDGELPEGEDYPHFVIDMERDFAINPDFVGILYVPMLDIRLPMVKAKDNSEYLNKTFEGQKNSSGCIFVDCEAKEGFLDLNTFIYGHNMKNGTMFGNLKRFYREEGLCAADPRFYIFTKDKVFDYRIFGYEIVKPGSPLLQRIQKMPEYDPYVEEIRKESAYQNEEVDLTNRPPLVTLYTCYGSEHRDKFLVHGALRKIFDLSERNR